MPIKMLMLVALLSALASGFEQNNPEPAIGAKLKTLRMNAEAGEHITLSGSAGRLVVLSFFTTWCVPCRAELQELNKAVQSGRLPHVTLIAIDEEETQEKVTPFLKEMHLVFPVSIDNGQLGHYLRVYEFPTTLVLGPDNTLLAHWPGRVTDIVNSIKALEPKRKQP